MTSLLVHVSDQVNAAEQSYPASRELQDPMFQGWIPWSAFHLEKPEDTMSFLRRCDQYAAIQNLFTRFAMYSLVGREGQDYGRFVYLTTFRVQLSADRSQTHVDYDRQALHSESYAVGKAFVVQVSLSTVTGESHTATVWFENDVIEIFNPWEYRSATLGKIIGQHVLPFMRQKWLKAGAKPKIKIYKLGAGIEPLNWWNTYFILLRSTHDEPVDRLFSTYVDVASVYAMRDRVVQACGRIIAKCAKERRGKEGLQFFGPESPVMDLSRELVEITIPNMFNRCYIPGDALWNTLENIDPEMSAEAPEIGGGSAGQVNTAEWPADVDPAWKPFIETTKKKMVFLSP